jgi:hypothetical protein
MPEGRSRRPLDETTTLALTALDPGPPNGPAARMIAHDTWTASDYAGVFEADRGFDRGTNDVEVGTLFTQDVTACTFEGVDRDGSGALPLPSFWHVRAARRGPRRRPVRGRGIGERPHS